MKHDTPKLWRDMTPEGKGALLLAHHEGKVIEQYDLGHWGVSAPVEWIDSFAYRVRPEPASTPMVVPWEALADWVQWVARDKDGDVFAHENKPREENDHWSPPIGRCEGLDAVKIDPGTCDWRDSLQKRPEGV